MLPFFGRWCRRYSFHFTAVGATFNATAKVNAARFSAVGVDITLSHFTAVGATFYATAKVNAA